MSSSSNIVVRPFHVMELAVAGFKVVPLAADGKGAAIPWTPIYDNAGWDLIELSKNYGLFQHGIATCFGLVVMPKSGDAYYLNCLDMDSQNVVERLNQLIDGARQKTWVTKTRKGYHVYWLSTAELAPIRTEDCMPGWSFEIKTDNSGGLATLPPSRHRNDPSFVYQNIGQPYLGISDEFYQFVLGKLRDKLFAKHEWRPSRRNQAQNIPWPSITLTDDEVHEIADAVSAPNSGYAHGLRHRMSVALAGFLCKNGVDYDSAKQVFTEIARQTRDEEKRSRLLDLKDTYKKAENDKQIVGFYLLSELSPLVADKLVKIMDDIRDKRMAALEETAAAGGG
jgi:hypothetical protein